MPWHAMHPMRDLFWKVFHMHGELICNLYALLCWQQNFIIVKSRCYTLKTRSSSVGRKNKLTRRVRVTFSHISRFSNLAISLGWFQWSPGCISLWPKPRQLSLSLSLTTVSAAGYSSRLQSISISFLSPSQYHHSRLNHFRIEFMDNEFKKTI
jgi:hypothetical protein